MIIERIKQFFKKMFGINKIKCIEAPKIEEGGVNIESTQEKDISNFKEEISLKNDDNYRILNLQKEFKEGKIEAEEISKEDTELLILMYIEQITQKIKRINEYETKMRIELGQQS